MEYRFSSELRPGYLYVTVTGPNTIETIRRYTGDIRDACMRHRQKRVLVVVNLHGARLSMLDVYKAVSIGAEEVAGLALRSAYVDLNPDSDITNMQIAEDAATSRGTPVRAFRDIASAEAWLLGRS